MIQQVPLGWVPSGWDPIMMHHEQDLGKPSSKALILMAQVLLAAKGGHSARAVSHTRWGDSCLYLKWSMAGKHFSKRKEGEKKERRYKIKEKLRKDIKPGRLTFLTQPAYWQHFSATDALHTRVTAGELGCACSTVWSPCLCGGPPPPSMLCFSFRGRWNMPKISPSAQLRENITCICKNYFFSSRVPGQAKLLHAICTSLGCAQSHCGDVQRMTCLSAWVAQAVWR